ncbi:unnamed protein product [Didymodactylos carnosus]|uniref:NAD(P)(+)--arginine ADP-ribosyltransferase n=1 Tax=Didymodactylos carnosus TaxID=1234261 RepID=A0A814KSP7_9BILA|nr:unnamed protein product [Didymodactylos carnosus]CAF1174194.1 unnamed protein product [Didymodactylos carnosus]CAF3824474.1 unnamed protein product [Didymodactylos carnosus]CAF3985420.1 unnamed protein product [Didymodactylos carnosus]
MASASAVAAEPVFLRPRNFQWYWNSSANPWSSTNSEEDWQKYTDVENEIIEDALSDKREEAELDGDYFVNLKNLMQYYKADKNRQRPIKRVQLATDRTDVHLREERFAFPVILATNTDDASTTTTSDTEDDEKDPLYELKTGYRRLSLTYKDLELEDNNDKSLADIVEEAAAGILNEGAKLSKLNEAQWLAQQLRLVKQFGEDKKAAIYINFIPDPIGVTCIYLYTKESFWYKLLNAVLRNHQTATLEQVKTLGPFCLLLDLYMEQNRHEAKFTVYRGLTLTDAEREEIMKQYPAFIKFMSFTSTSRNQKKAERFGNTLLVFDLDVKDSYFANRNVRCGIDVSSISAFPNEEEFTIGPGRCFHFVRYEYHSETNRHIIYLKSPAWD